MYCNGKKILFFFQDHFCTPFQALELKNPHFLSPDFHNCKKEQQKLHLNPAEWLKVLGKGEDKVMMMMMMMMRRYTCIAIVA